MVKEGKYSLNIFLHFNFLYGRMCNVLADVAEWQTQQTQNLPVVTSCGFKSRHPHLHYMNKAVLYAECELQAYLRMEDTLFMFARHGRSLTSGSLEHAQIVGSV